MPELCATLEGEAFCMPVDLTVFTDPRHTEVAERPRDAPGLLDVTSDVPIVRTRVARGAAPDAWPRDERIPAVLLKGQERLACEVMVRPSDEGEARAEELLLYGEEVFRAVMGRTP